MLRFRMLRSHALQDRRRGSLQFLGVGDVERHAAGIGLVRDVRREDLRHHRKIELHLLIRHRDRLGWRRRHAQRAEHAAGFLLVQPPTCRRAACGRRRRARRPATGAAQRRAPVAPGADRVGARFRRAEAGDAGFVRAARARRRRAARRTPRAACDCGVLPRSARSRSAAGTARSCRRPRARGRSGRRRAARSAPRCRSPSSHRPA